VTLLCSQCQITDLLARLAALGDEIVDCLAMLPAEDQETEKGFAFLPINVEKMAAIMGPAASDVKVRGCRLHQCLG
jgi:hypothetical protein